MKDEERKGDQLLRRAKILFASGQQDESIKCFTLAEDMECDQIDLWMSRGAAEMSVCKYLAAEEDFTRILEREKDNERALYFRGVARVALGRYEQGIEDLTASLVKNPKRGIAKLVRGLAFSQIGRKFDADLDFNGAEPFSDAEINSFKKLFGEKSTLFEQAQSIRSDGNAPWNNLMSRSSASKLLNLLE